MSDGHLFDLTLAQLSADARKAGADLPPIQRPGASKKDLRKLLAAAAVLAPTVTYPLAPSIRVATSGGQFIVNVKDGRLQLISWSTKLPPTANPSVDEIVALISGEEIEHGADLPDAPAAKEAPNSSRQRKRILIGALLVVAIVGLNAITFVQARRPPGNFLPNYSLVAPEPAERFLARTAGNYETGSRSGDRRLQITRDGRITWIKFGAGKAAAEQREMTAQVVTTSGSEALLTSQQAIISVKDPLTLVYFGDPYTRVAN